MNRCTEPITLCCHRFECRAGFSLGENATITEVSKKNRRENDVGVHERFEFGKRSEIVRDENGRVGVSNGPNTARFASIDTI